MKNAIPLLIFVLVCNLFFFVELGGGGVALVGLSALIWLLLQFRAWTLSHRRSAVIASALIAAIGAAAFTATPFFHALAFWVSIAILTGLYYLMRTNQAEFLSFSQLAFAIPNSLSSILRKGRLMCNHAVFAQTAEVTRNDQIENKNLIQKVKALISLPALKMALVGIVVSVPIVFGLTALLSSADPIFAKAVDTFFSHFQMHSFWRGLENFSAWIDGWLGIPVVRTFLKHSIPTIILGSFLFVAVHAHFSKFSSPGEPWRARPLHQEFTIITWLSLIPLLGFNLIQWQYVFLPPVAAIDLSQFGISTYSEYVSQGATQLLFVTAFVYGLIWLGILLLDRHRSQGKLLLIGQLAIISQLIVVQLSFFRRLWLYQDFHGMTLIRYFGAIAMGVLVVFVLTAAARLFIRNRRQVRKLVRIETLTIPIVTILAIFFPIEAHIVQHPPTVNDRVDYTYLARLSASGHEGWKNSFAWAVATQDELDARLSADRNTPLATTDLNNLVYTTLILQQLSGHYQHLTYTTGTADDQAEFQRHLRDFASGQLTPDTLKYDHLLEGELVFFSDEELASGYPYDYFNDHRWCQVSRDCISWHWTNEQRLPYTWIQQQPPTDHSSSSPRHQAVDYTLPGSLRHRILQFSFANKTAYRTLQENITLDALLQRQKQSIRLRGEARRQYNEGVSGAYIQLDIRVNAPLIKTW